MYSMSIKLLKILFEQQQESPTPENVMVVDNDEDGLVTIEDSEASDAIESDADLITATLEYTEEREKDVDTSDEENSSETDNTTSNANDGSGVEELKKALETEPPDIFSGTVLGEAIGVGGKAFALRLVSKSGGLLKFGGTKDRAYRLRLVDPKQDIAKAIKNALRGFKLKIVAPGMSTGKFVAKSGKYSTYYVQAPDKSFVPIVFSAGANEGQKFEKAIKNSISSRKGKAYNALLEALNQIYGVEDTEETKIKRVVKAAGGSTRVKRPLTSVATNVGPILSDMTIILKNDEEIYVSLKNVSGATFANTGYSGAFVLTKNKSGQNVVKAQPSASSPATDEFLLACGVDKNLVAKGLTDYINKTFSKPQQSNFRADFATVQKFLVAQLGYGYVYFRQLSGGKYKIIDLSTLQKTKKVIGNVISVNVTYPFYLGASRSKKSKQCTIKIGTTTGDTYIVEVRSTKGGVINNMQCNIKTK